MGCDKKRKVDNNMRCSGDIDDKTKNIRINTKKGDVINTILHEEIHDKNWDKTEKQVKKQADKQEKSLTITEMIKLLKKYRRA